MAGKKSIKKMKRDNEIRAKYDKILASGNYDRSEIVYLLASRYHLSHSTIWRALELSARGL